VSVAPFELQCIPADWFDVLQHDEQRHIVGFEPPHSGPFIDTSRTGAMQAEMAHWIDTVVSITPGDSQYSFVKPGQVSRFKLGVCHVH
jgi:hypothetical protein